MKRRLGRRVTLLSVIAACLVAAALVGPTVPAGTRAKFRALVFDNSASFQPDHEKLRRFVDTYTSDLGPRDRWCLWTIGREPILLIGPRPGGGRLTLPSLPVADEASGIWEALRAAGSSVGDIGEIVLLSDGMETRAADESVWRDIAAPVFPVPVDFRGVRDARISSVSAPRVVSPGQPFDIEAALGASGVRDIVVNILRDGIKLDSRIVQVGKSGYNLRFSDSIEEKGLYLYEINVETEGDAFPQNDSWKIPVEAGELRSVLVVTPYFEESAVFKLLARAPGFSVEARDARSFAEHTGLDSYCAVVLEGVKAGEIPAHVAEDVASYVMDTGGGFVVVSGGPGRDGSDCAGTAVEEVLPVDFGVGTGTRHLIVAMDRSGSMAQIAGTSVKIRMARKAVLAAAAFIGDSDLLHVLSFNTNASKVYSNDGKVDPGTLGAKLAGLEAAGGTDVVPALNMAAGLFEEDGAATRILIVISDGFTSERGLSAAVDSLASAGVTVSAVGVGDDVNTDLLAQLASRTNGRWFHLADASEMPAVVAEEAESGMSSSFATGSFSADLVSSHPALPGITAPPGFEGYTRCRLKKDARAALVTEGNNPLLALWRVSSGKSAFVSVPLGQEYAGKWLKWRGLQSMIEGTVRWCARDPLLPDKIDHRFEDGDVVIEVMYEAGDSAELYAIYKMRGTETAAGLREIEPGIWRGRLGIDSAGLISVRIMQEDSGEIASTIISVPYAREFRAIGLDGASLARIASSTGGRVLVMGEMPGRKSEGRRRRSLSPFLAALAVACLFTDVIKRKH